MRTAILILAASVAAATAPGGESPIPTAPPAERYARMSQHSPFALATAAAPVAPPQASFATNWFVTGIGRLNNIDFVSIQARDLSTQFSLIGHEPNRQNEVSLVEVQWSEFIGKSTVTLRKGSEVARLEFNEAVVRGPSVTGAAAGGVGAGAKPAGGTPGARPAVAAGGAPGTRSTAVTSPTAQAPGEVNLIIHRRVTPLSTPR